MNNAFLVFKRSRYVVLALLFIAYLSVFSIANLPALRQAWWYFDDFRNAKLWHVDSSLSNRFHLSMRPFSLALKHARPVEALWFVTFLLDGSPDRGPYNILLRFIQCGLHSIAVTVAGIIIWQETRKWTAFFAVLPFLLWPFNSEAVLWRTGGTYPLAALLSLLGIYVLRHSERSNLLMYAISSLSIALAMLTNQSAALAGIVVWTLTLSFKLLKEDVFYFKKRLYLDMIPVLFGYLIGGGFSYILAHQFHGYQRATFATNLTEKLFFLVKLNSLFIAWPKLYPYWLSGLHVALLTGVAVIFVVRAYKMGWPMGKVLLSAILLMTTFVTPYAMSLLVAENWPSWRVMYLAPFLITGIWIMWDKAIGINRIGTLISVCVLIVLLIGYLKIAWVNAGEYVRLFEADMSVLHELEAYATNECIECEQVFVATSQDFLRDWNPYHLTYVHADSKLSAYLIRWAAHPFIRWFSRLKPTEDTFIKQECISQCRITKEGKAFQFFKLPRRGVLCVCP